MKSRNLTLITAMTLFAALASPVRLAAQEHSKKHSRYKLQDIGTFGGPASEVLVFAKVVSHKGIAAGGANTATPDPACNNPLGGSSNCFVQHAFRYHNGVLTDLGTLPGGNPDTNFSLAQAINEHGLIGGASENGLIDPNVGTAQFHAVFWEEDGEIIDLGTLGGYESQVVWMNNHDRAVGFSQNLIPDPFPINAFGTQTRAVLWQNGTIHDLGTLGGSDSFAVWVSDKSQVTGFSYTNSTPNPVTGVPTIDPFFWENGNMVDLGTLGGTQGFPAQGMSRRGQIVGNSNLAGDLTTHPFLWQAGVMRDLGTLGGSFGIAQAINDAGEAVGLATTAGDLALDAFSWKNGVMTDLGVVTGDLGSDAFWINSTGQIVGTSFDSTGASCNHNGGTHAFLYEDGGPMIDLNTLVPPNSGLTLRSAHYINDRGEIAGVGTPSGVSQCDVDTSGHAFLLIPCGDTTEEGCGDDRAASSAVTQSNAAAVTDARPVTHSASAPSGMAAIQARLARWFHVPVRKAPSN